MSLLSRRKKPEPPKPAPQEATPPREPAQERDLERPLLSLVYALRTWGQYALRAESEDEPDDTGAADSPPPLEQWARRAYSFSEGARVDFDDLDRFVLRHRSGEQRSVDRSLRNLREALWAFIECFSKSLGEDAANDDLSRQSLDRLRDVVVSGDVAQIRREAVLTAQTVRSSITTRQQRQRVQVEILTAKLDDVTTALVRAKRDGETDALTGLYNRAAFDAHLQRMASMAVLMASPPLLLVLDVDHFKWVNDRFGHETGDLVLRTIALRFGAACRRGQDFLARYGGDEFVAVLDSVSIGAEMAQADRILFAMRDVEIPTGKEPLRVSCSMGLARARAGETPQDWFRRADEALYRAKRAGRDRAVFEAAAPTT
jgi:diguanylate cyclase (GGDEF)-like protein